MTDYDFILSDRIGVIQSANSKYDLLSNAYLSFSGGKDSTILHHLLDMALPNNQIPRVYIDTGIEYNDVKSFVLGLSRHDSRFVIIKPSVSVIQMLKRDGYPFKSKQHSHNLMIYQHSGMCRTVRGYLGVENTSTKFLCPKRLMYQFTEDFEIKVSDKCCLRMKKQPAKKYELQSGRKIALTGMRRSEGGERQSIKGCILLNSDGSLHRFHPLLVVSDEWESEFLNRENVSLSRLYYPPFNFKRTGCKGCPFSLDLQEQLELMDLYLPSERKHCEYIWKPIYDEYRRLGYRLDKQEQLRLF